MFNFLFDIPLAIAAPALILTLGLFAAGGLLLVRRFVLPRLRIRTEDSEFSGAIVQAIMVFYGLAVALIAVNVWQTYSDTSKAVSQEATAIAALYRDVRSYPPPTQTALRDALRNYTWYVIREAWPEQRAGRVPRGGVVLVDELQAILTKFEPATEGQKILHAETLRAYNRMIETRRIRLDSVRIALPGAMWSVILGGAVIALLASCFFRVEDARLHLILVVLLAAFMALVIFVVLAFDRPFRGDLGIGPEAYELVYDQLMKP